MMRFALLIAAALAATPAMAAIPPDLALQPVTSGLDMPVAIAAPNDGSGRIFVAEIAGRVRVVRSGAVVVAPAIDVSALTTTSDCGGECGLIGLAFDPAFASNGYVYTLHTDAQRNDVVLRHHFAAGADVADAAHDTVITVGQGSGQHNGGELKFGPDGYLYISVGDGAGNGAVAQQLDSLRGKILRIAVSTLPYTVPASNPFASDGNAATRAEIWHYGLRNPWRMSFDRRSGDLWIADVGGNFEELHRVPAGTGGLNFGWPCYSGATPIGSCTVASHTPPDFAYNHNAGDCAVIGGFRFDGPVAMMKGTYVYGDFCSRRIWGATQTTGWTSQLLRTAASPITSFGEDPAGWIYLAEYGSPARLLRLYSERIFGAGFE
jgi:glucose/arabinose dehydrogenase